MARLVKPYHPALGFSPWAQFKKLTDGASKTKPKRAPKPKETPSEYVLVARHILVRPPLRHRGEKRSAGLTVFEFCIGTAAMVLARRSRASDAYHAGIREGGRALAKMRESDQPVQNIDVYPAHEQFEAVGSAGFERGRERHFDDNANKDWCYQTSRDELLRNAGLSRNGPNNRRVAAALDRLTRSVRNDPSVLIEWRQVTETKIELVVATEWLSLQRYNKVKLPLPTSSRDALALHLFLASIKLGRRNQIAIPAATLYARLGIRTGRPTHDERALRKALRVVNELRVRNEASTTVVLLEDSKGRWRFVELASGDEEIHIEEAKDAIELHQIDQLTWNEVAQQFGRTENQILEAVQLYKRRLEQDAARMEDDGAEDELADEERFSLDEEGEAALDRAFERLEVEDRWRRGRPKTIFDDESS